MIGYVLAAGLGTRLRPVTDHIPKALVPVCGIPQLTRSLDYLAANGIAARGANSHHFHEQIQALRENGSVGAFELFHEHGRIRGTGGALYFARDFLSSESSFCILNVDMVTDLNLAPVIEDFDESEDICRLICAPPAAQGTVWYDPGSGEYAGVVAGAHTAVAAGRADFVGIALYKSTYLELLSQDDFCIQPTWRRARERGCPVKVALVEDFYWCDAGSPGTLAQCHFDVLDGRVDLPVADGLELDLESFRAWPKDMSADCREGFGRYVWTNSKEIGQGASLSRCVVFNGANVPDGASMTRKIVTPWCEVPFD